MPAKAPRVIPQPAYKAAPITGSKFRRFSRVVIDNPYQGTPQIVISEEEVTDVGGNVTAVPTGTLSYTFDPDDSLKEYSLASGTKTAANLDMTKFLASLFSIYRSQVDVRDGNP